MQSTVYLKYSNTINLGRDGLVPLLLLSFSRHRSFQFITCPKDIYFLAQNFSCSWEVGKYFLSSLTEKEELFRLAQEVYGSELSVEIEQRKNVKAGQVASLFQKQCWKSRHHLKPNQICMCLTVVRHYLLASYAPCLFVCGFFPLLFFFSFFPLQV